MSADKVQRVENDTAQRILAAALQIFLEKGYSAATTRAIAELADVNEVTLFRHFGSKKNLLTAVVERYSPLKGLIALLSEQLTGDFYQDLRALSDYIVHSMAEQPDIMRLVLFESHQIPELRDMLDFIPQQIIRLLTDYFTQQTLSGTLRSDLHPTLIAQTFFGFFATFGVGVRMRQERNLDMTISVEMAQAQLLEMFLHGVTPNDST
ncbi:MAG: TetR/AcrR family transcriptional regulator [Chloroflexota bacterium]